MVNKPDEDMQCLSKNWLCIIHSCTVISALFFCSFLSNTKDYDWLTNSWGWIERSLTGPMCKEARFKPGLFVCYLFV